MNDTSFLLLTTFSKISHFRGKIEFTFWKISLIVYIKRNRHYLNLKLKYKLFYKYHQRDVAGFLKITVSMH